MKLVKLFLVVALMGVALFVKAEPQPSAVLKSSNPMPLHANGITNFFRLSDRVYSGSAPDGNTGFSELERLGIKTIITVDGTRPEIELAHQHGLRYIHIPHGYDGISTNIQRELIKAVQSASPPVFVHCHHGTHRGPAAAAIVCMGTEGWSPTQALAWLKVAGTSSNYPGLFSTVRDFHVPTIDELKDVPNAFPEIAKVPDLVSAMVAIDLKWDTLKTFRKSSYRSRPDHPDLNPANEMTLLCEQFREAQRLADSKARGSEFLNRLRSIEIDLRKSADLLADGAGNLNSTRAQLDRHFDSIGQACISCHRAFRDNGEERTRRN